MIWLHSDLNGYHGMRNFLVKYVLYVVVVVQRTMHANKATLMCLVTVFGIVLNAISLSLTLHELGSVNVK